MANNNENKILNVPPLRFPEFTGEWQCKAIEKVAPLQRGFDLPTQNLVEGIYPVIYSNGILQHHDKYKCEAPGLITGRSGTIGKFTYIDSGFYWPHNTSLWVTDFCGNCPKFIYYLYQTVHIEQFSTGSGVPTLNRNDVHRYKTSVPTAIVEQEKIAKFLSILDERIVTQNKIIDKLQSLIKGIAQNITCSNKPNVHISECLECSSSTLQESDVFEHGAYPVYGANGIVGYLDNYNTENEAVYIIKDGSGVGTVSYVTGKCSATGTLNILQAPNGYSLRYLYYLLKVFNFEPYKTGMAIPHIYFKDYGKAKIFCPLYSEQLKYATLLSTIDDKLSTEQDILKSLNLEKQYLLCQMFI
ncbi:restriction endonuclease subunit S [Bacteroides uniformis]|uniref:restriction endonuclease subunit S n=1 Tax=Bacteroides uniformis TaxID=820 RepID=UPI0022E2437D|nr:restriction endonuclease subunit S [Bacteroides uniformis]